MSTSIHLAGELDQWPSKPEMAAVLRAARLSITVGRYSIRIEDCDHFVFQGYGGDLGDPSVDADADSLERMLHDGGRVSEALSDAGIRHRFELYDDDERLVGYLHHNWPPP